MQSNWLLRLQDVVMQKEERGEEVKDIDVGKRFMDAFLLKKNTMFIMVQSGLLLVVNGVVTV